MAPGLGVVAVVTTTAYLLALAPIVSAFSPLILALTLGMLVRHWRGIRETEVAGTAFAARTLLRVGVVLLGVRLDLGLLTSVGPLVLLGSILVVGSATVIVELIGRRMGLSKGLRLALAFGSGICGASAVLAAATVGRISEEDAGIAVGVISFVGTVGAVSFALFAAVANPDAISYGFLAGLTLQEVGQVVAAGYVLGPASGDAATLAKLTRVAMLAPALTVLARVSRGKTQGDKGNLAAEPSKTGNWSRFRFQGVLQQWGVPPFLLGFLAMAVIQSVGLLPPGVVKVAGTGSLLLTASAMAGLGLGLNIRALRRFGPLALVVGFLAFMVLVVLAAPYANLLASQ